MKAKELRELTDEELREMYDERRLALFEKRVRKDLEGDAAQNPVGARSLRRELARINTVLKERELEGVK
jgi:ribosomal protein L29